MNPTSETSPSLNTRFRSKSHRIIRLNTIEKQQNIVEPNILKKTSIFNKAKINSMKTIYSRCPPERIRKYTEIEDQFVSPQSPLKLSPFKQYESKLKLSAESWVIHDMKMNKYKRGWRSNKVTSFRGILRILILLCYCQIIKKHQSIKKLRIKISHRLLKQAKLKIKKSSKKISNVLSSNNKTFKTFQQGTIVYFIDLIKSMIISGNQDLLEYSMIFCGYLIDHLEKENSSIMLPQMLEIKDRKENWYTKTCIEYCSQNIIKTLGLIQSKIQSKGQYFELISTPNQICVIFLKGFMQQSLFREIISIQKHTFYIKYQVGYNYWQDRIAEMKSENQNRKSQRFCCLVYKGNKNYQCVCYNKELQILMVIEDSKFSMADLDTQVLENWYKSVTKPISSKPKSSISPEKKKKSIFPVLQISKALY